jgi:exopolyphosphatase/guanosine-5'-triphosphate,3'-diphosphate pyrophosphatase
MIAIEEILHLNRWTTTGARGGGITKDGLTRLREALIDGGHADRLQIPGLKAQRAGIIAAGVAIARAAFKALPLKGLQSTTAALREGVLYDLLGRFLEGDLRETTIDHLMTRFHVDRRQAARVEETALRLFARARWLPASESEQARSYLAWAARLHELGLSISFHSYHKHGAYILENTPLPGFSRDDSRMVATLVLVHRKKLSRDALDKLPQHLRENCLKLAVLLRLATRLCRSRSQEPTPDVGLEIQGRTLTLTLPEGFLARHPLTQAEFNDEAERLTAAGFGLVVR